MVIMMICDLKSDLIYFLVLALSHAYSFWYINSFYGSHKKPFWIWHQYVTFEQVHWNIIWF